LLEQSSRNPDTKAKKLLNWEPKNKVRRRAEMDDRMV